MTINKEIEKIIDHKLNQHPAPVKCTIKKTYTDNYVDAETSIGDLKYVKCIGANIKVGATGVVIYLNGGFNDCIIIT